MSVFCPYTYDAKPVRLEFPATFPMPSKQERDRRWQAIRKAMNKHRVDCLIVATPRGSAPILPYYLSYISNYVPYFGLDTYLVFDQASEPRLAVSSFQGPQFLHIALETSWINDVVMSLHPIQEVLSKIKQQKLAKGRLGIVGYKAGVFPACGYDSLRDNLPQAHFEDATDVMSEAMNEVSRTSQEESTFLRKACEILDLSFEAAARVLKPGVTECEVWAAAEHAILKNGGWYPHFMLGVSGPSPTFARSPASHRTLKKGDVILFEINATYAGVSPQIMYALSIGQPGKEIREMFAFCKELYDFSLAELEKQRVFIEIESDLVQRIHAAGYKPMTPQIHIYNTAIIIPMGSPPRPGDYFTVHPNLANREFTGGAKFGDTVRIKQDGAVERLQKTPADLNIIE